MELGSVGICVGYDTGVATVGADVPAERDWDVGLVDG